MGQLLTGKRLESVKAQLAEEVELCQSWESMNYLAFLNYIVEKNKQFGLNPTEW